MSAVSRRRSPTLDGHETPAAATAATDHGQRTPSGYRAITCRDAHIPSCTCTTYSSCDTDGPSDDGSLPSRDSDSSTGIGGTLPSHD